MSAVIHVEQERDQSCLGASEAAGVLGLDRYNPPIKIWRRHRGLEVEDTGPSEAAEWGQLLEPVVRGKYATSTRSRVLVQPDSVLLTGWLRCTPDGFAHSTIMEPGVVEVHAGWFQSIGLSRNIGLVQCKTADGWLAHEWDHGPPPKYEVQVRVEMAVTGLPWCDIAALIGGNRFVIHRVHRNLEIEAAILKSLRSFWTLVQNGTEPLPDHTNAWRAHVSELMPRDSKVVIPSDDGVRDELLLPLRAAKVRAAAAKEEVDRLNNHLLLHLSAHGATALQDDELGRFSAYRAGAGMDWKGYAMALESALRGGERPAVLSFKRPAKTWAIKTPRGFAGDDDES